MREDDAFPAWLSSLAGSTVDFVPGAGGFDDAVAALSFSMLCDRHDIALAPEGEASADRPTVFGSLDVAAGALDQRGIVLPMSVDHPEALEPALHGGLTLFLRDPVSLRLAELQGVPAARRLLGRNLAEHLDLQALGIESKAGEGMLRIGVGEVLPGGGDGVTLSLSGGSGRWRSPTRCREAIGDVLTLVGRYAEVITDSATLAILAAKLGRSVTLRPPSDGAGAALHRPEVAPPHPRVALEATGDAAPDASEASEDEAAEAVRLRRLVAAARRDAQSAEQEREALAFRVADLQERLHAGFSSAVIAAERDTVGVRLVPASLFEAQASAARDEMREREETANALRDRAEAAEQRLAESGSRERSSAEAAAAARRRAEAAERHREVAAALEASLAARTDQVLALQDAVDRAHLQGRLAESRIAQMRALIDERGAAAAAAEGAEQQLRAQVRRVTSSFSWRITRPLRGIGRIIVWVRGGRGVHRA